MVPGNLTPAAGVNRGGRMLSNLQLTGDDGTEMCNHAVGGFLSVLDAQAATLRVDEAGVPDLPARLGVEGSALEKHLAVLPFDSHIDRLSTLSPAHEARLGGEL